MTNEQYDDLTAHRDWPEDDEPDAPMDVDPMDDTDCEHRRMADPTGPDAGVCLECGVVCICDEDQLWADADDCPIHGTGR